MHSIESICRNCFQELESLFSEHFGRTPLCTPAHSQELSSDDDNDQVEGACSAVMDKRIGSFVHGQPAESSNGSTDDDGNDGDAFSQDDSIQRFHESGCGCAKKCHEKFDARPYQNAHP